MKTFLNLCSAASLVCLFSFVARDLGISAPIVVARETESRVARKTSTPVVFNAHDRSKVVQYFDTYQGDPFGLPPACAAGMKVGEIPASWDSTGIASGRIVPESERSLLVDAPVELARVLPRSQVEVCYYLAGGYLVAVDPGYKILDSVRIPTVRSDVGGADGQTRPLQFVNYVKRHQR